jgi:hypothetical protein
LCGVVNARVIDGDGVYDPRQPNDRLLLGLKGTMSEFELTVIRARLQSALEAKAARGELRMPVPIGYRWAAGETVILDPDLRVQEAVRLVFQKFEELGSGRQVLLWLCREQVDLPCGGDDRTSPQIAWRPPAYRNVISILKNPFYAGIYARGKSSVQTSLINGRLQKHYGRAKPRSEWAVFLPDHHEGYISLGKYEEIQERLARNAYGKSDTRPKSGRGGRALLSGLIRCRRCGRRMAVTYSGHGARTPRYWCRRAHNQSGLDPCISMGALRPDEVVARELLTVLQPLAIQAAMRADEKLTERDDDRRRALELEFEQARYEARLATRRYEACDPDNRLVAKELESRWNRALEHVREVEGRLDMKAIDRGARPDQEMLLSLAEDIEQIWQSPASDMRSKQRIVRTLVEEVIIDVDDTSNEVVVVIHWKGGVHSEHRARKLASGEHRIRAVPEVVDVVREMAGRWSDAEIASTLNRMGTRTGKGNTWDKHRVYSLRMKRGIRGARSIQDGEGLLTMEQAAEKLGVSRYIAKKLVSAGLLPARQVAERAPWLIRAMDLELPDVVSAVSAHKAGRPLPCKPTDQDNNPMLPGICRGDAQ